MQVFFIIKKENLRHPILKYPRTRTQRWEAKPITSECTAEKAFLRLTPGGGDCIWAQQDTLHTVNLNDIVC